MKLKRIMIPFAAVAGLALMSTQPISAEPLADAIKAESRTPKNAARDQFRNPGEVLRFMGIKPNMTVVEIWPGGGWWTEILAPYLKDNGNYYAAHFPDNDFLKFYKPARNRFQQKLAANEMAYGKVKLTSFFPPEDAEIAPKESADMVLTFRNVHNWIRLKFEQKAFDQFYAALKPGGVLGVIEHRAKPGTTLEQMDKSGYVTEAYTIELAKKAGFVLVDQSDVNNNPKDTKDHPKGVWTLPPTLAMKEIDRDKYLAIGESDRFVLKFKKPTIRFRY